MDFWDEVSGIYDLAEAVNGRVYRRMTALTEKLVPRGARVLDCAAGTGELALAAAKKAERVTCTDLSAAMLQRAKKKARLRGAANIGFDTRNIFDLKDADDTYDVVIAGNVLHLLKNPEDAVRELCRVTKPGGRLLLPTFVSLEEKMRFWLGLYKLAGFRPEKNYTPESYRDMLLRCGCGEVKTRLIEGRIPCCYAVIKKPADRVLRK